MELLRNPKVQVILGSVIILYIFDIILGLGLGFLWGWKAGLGIAILTQTTFGLIRYIRKSDPSFTKEGIYKTYLDVIEITGTTQPLGEDEVFRQVTRRVYQIFLAQTLVGMALIYWSTK